MLLGALLLTGVAGAQEPQPEPGPRRWEYARFDWPDLVVSGAGVATVVATTLIWPPTGDVRWRGGVLFDDAVRDSLRAESRAGRDDARTVGDAFYFSGALFPTIVDGLLVTLLIRGEPDIAGQQLLINFESYAVAGAVLTGSERVFARARPSDEPCQSNPDYEVFCGEDDRASSMISGHSGVVAISAGLMCAHHQYLDLYGSDVADAAACALGVGMAAGTGVARIINDRHYATDIVAAWAVGALGGYVLPVLRYYSRPAAPVRATAWTIVPAVTRTSAGAAWVGVF